MTEPGMVTALGAAFLEICTIQEATYTQSSTGRKVPSWANLAGHVGLACHLAAPGVTAAQQDQADEMTVTTVTHEAMLGGYYPDVEPGMQALINSAAFAIVSVHHSMQALTRLKLQQVTP